MKRNYKKGVLMILLIGILILLLVYAVKYFNGESGVSDVVYTLQLEDLPHYQLHEEVSCNTSNFTVTDVVEIEEGKLWQVNTDIENLQEFDSNYTFFIANNDILVVGSASYVENGNLYICNSPDNKKALSQICLLQNGTMESLSVINLY